MQISHLHLKKSDQIKVKQHIKIPQKTKSEPKNKILTTLSSDNCQETLMLVLSISPSNTSYSPFLKGVLKRATGTRLNQAPWPRAVLSAWSRGIISSARLHQLQVIEVNREYFSWGGIACLVRHVTAVDQ